MTVICIVWGNLRDTHDDNLRESIPHLEFDFLFGYLWLLHGPELPHDFTLPNSSNIILVTFLTTMAKCLMRTTYGRKVVWGSQFEGIQFIIRVLVRTALAKEEGARSSSSCRIHNHKVERDEFWYPADFFTFFSLLFSV